jgi:HrpA-like RNA helicase
MQITPHLPKIVSLISTNATVSIVAPTGSGKSVAVPAAIAASGARCFVTVPTRTAAISLTEYQRILQQAASPNSNINQINKLVGYAAEGNVNYGPETVIAYVTGGHARRKMLSYFNKGIASPIDFCDVLMVDEVHSGSLDTTIIISLWMKAASSGVQVPRLVIASATPVPIAIDPTPAVYTVDLAAFPIEYRYLDKDIDIDDPNGLLYNEAAKIAADIHRNTPINSGHILIFAPGSTEVENVAASLKEQLGASIEGKSIDIIPAFGALKPEDIALIYKQTGPNERKAVIATNIAEMSITITDVGHVIDTMVEKRAETSQSGGFRLTTHYISKDSAKQRAGRTGRTRPGICYRMCTQETFERLEDHRPPEIQRIPIYETVMELLDVGLSPENVIKGIDVQRIVHAVQLLSRLGMVTNTENGIAVTDLGHFAPKFHISVRNSAFLWHWIQAGYPVFPGIVVAVLIDCYGPSYFWIPRRKPEMSTEEYNLILKEYKTKYFGKYVGYNDLETCLNMWSDLMKNTGGIQTSQKALVNWARDNSINNKKIRELLLIVEQCVNAATRNRYTVTIGPFTTEGVMTAARPILLSVYSDMTMIHRRDITYFNPISREEYRLDNRDAVNKLIDNPPKGIIALVTAEIKTQRGVFRVIGFGVDTDKDGLGRPIVEQGKVTIPRGPRVITHARQPIPTTTTQPDINEALGLLETLNIGGTQPLNINPPVIQVKTPIQTPTRVRTPGRTPGRQQQNIPQPTIPQPTIPQPTIPNPTSPTMTTTAMRTNPQQRESDVNAALDLLGTIKL